MKSIAMAISFVLAGLTATGLQAEIYSWTDENGVKHYSQIPPSDGQVRIKTTPEIPPSPEIEQADRKINEDNFEAILEELDKENKPEAPKRRTTPKKLSRQQRIQNEQRKLEEKLAYLENLPPEAFANSRSRNAIIGEYHYRLQQLASDPDRYFEQYGF
ncbi:MAG: DUF4124 domain-containing protein [Desulfobacterales bacterium]